MELSKFRDKLSDLKLNYFYPINSFLHLTINSLYDYYKNVKNTSFFVNSERRDRAIVLIEGHRIEKALTLETNRTDFSVRPIKRLLNIYKVTKDSEIHRYILDVFINLSQRCPTHLMINEIEAKLNKKIHVNEVSKTSKTNEILSLEKASAMNFIKLASSRRSTRNYKSKKFLLSNFFTNENLRNITPSVCNRRGFRYVQVSEKNKIQQVLELQNGNGSFRSKIHNLALIVADPSKMINPEERNQYYIDGGLFAMNFLHMLTFNGISSCCLNWSRNMSADIKFRRLGLIKSHEELLFMVAFGEASSEASVTNSTHNL
jgi:nitroreductase